MDFCERPPATGASYSPGTPTFKAARQHRQRVPRRSARHPSQPKRHGLCCCGLLRGVVSCQPWVGLNDNHDASSLWTLASDLSQQLLFAGSRPTKCRRTFVAVDSCERTQGWSLANRAGFRSTELSNLHRLSAIYPCDRARGLWREAVGSALRATRLASNALSLIPDAIHSRTVDSCVGNVDCCEST